MHMKMQFQARTSSPGPPGPEAGVSPILLSFPKRIFAPPPKFLHENYKKSQYYFRNHVKLKLRCLISINNSLDASIWGRLGLLGLTRIARNPKIDFRNPIFAIIDFRKSIIGFGAIRVNPSNPSRAFLDPKSPILDFESQLLQKPTSSNPSRCRGQKPTSSNPRHPSNPS